MARILIADDDVAYRKAFCDGLTVLGHQVDGVPDGASAMDALRSAEYDVVFLDVIMRGGGANDSTKICRPSPRRSPWTP